MTRRARILAFGSAGLLVVAGIAGGIAVGGLTGQVLLIALVSLGFGAVLLLLFLEVGLSEDRERVTEEQRRHSSRVDAPRWPWLPRGPRPPR